jgi:hypothetical protein
MPHDAHSAIDMSEYLTACCRNLEDALRDVRPIAVNVSAADIRLASDKVWHADEKFREQFVICKINGTWWMRRRAKYACKPDVKPADPFVRSLFRDARKSRGKQAAADIWDDLGYLLCLPDPDRK